MISGTTKQGDTLIDFACGKAGDLPKWIGAELSFVFGIDISKDNLENRFNGACTRFLNHRKEYKNMQQKERGMVEVGQEVWTDPQYDRRPVPSKQVWIKPRPKPWLV